MTRLTQRLRPIVVPSSLDQTPVLSPEETEWLRSTHLPLNYFSLSPEKQREARLQVLTSWFNPSVVFSWQLMDNLDNYLAAHKLWVDYYLKTSSWCEPMYYWKDPRHKYELLRTSLNDPLDESAGTKSVIVAPRGTTKTKTLVFEAASLMACCRPGTMIVVCEMNKDRTSEELRNIRRMLENNERIAEDFARSAPLFPAGARKGLPWNDTILSFYNRSEIQGVSMGSAMRGKRCLYWILDDPDDGTWSRNSSLRRQFFSWLHRTVLPICGSRRGTKLLWVQTVTGGTSVVRYVLPSRINEISDDEDFAESRKLDFSSWNIKLFPLIYLAESGARESVWPEYKTPEDFDKMKASEIGRSAVMAEYQGVIINEGQSVFPRTVQGHGWMRTQDDRFLDFSTGRAEPWRQWMENLHVVGAADLGSGSVTSDPSAVVLVGLAPDNRLYILDAWVRRVPIDKLICTVFDHLVPLWNIQEFGWEMDAFQKVLAPLIKREADLRRVAGKRVPRFHGLQTFKKDKAFRAISTLTPLFMDHRIVFPHLMPYQSFQSCPHPHRTDIEELLEEMDGYTEEGTSGGDDAVDALEMACRILSRRRPRCVEESNAGEKDLQEWQEMGADVSLGKLHPMNYPVEARSMLGRPRMDYNLEPDPYD